MFRRDRSKMVDATAAAATVKKQAEMLLDQMAGNLTELRSLILGEEERGRDQLDQ